MDANAVRAYVAQKWPAAAASPLANAMGGASAMLLLEASDADAAIARAELLADAREHARVCLEMADGWTVETLGHNIESAYGADLTLDECDEIAAAILAKATGEAA